jgi:hypothetical protein
MIFRLNNSRIYIALSSISLFFIFLSGCGKSYTTCDCADLTYDLFKEYDKIILSDKSFKSKVLDMRKTKRLLKKDERYKFCKEQGVRPLSIIHYPTNKKIFTTCDSWKEMEVKMDVLWEKIKDKYGREDNDDESE